MHRLVAGEDGEAVHVRVAERRSGTVVLGGRARTRASAQAALARMRFALGVDDDLRPFHERFRDDPLIGRHLRNRWTVFEPSIGNYGDNSLLYFRNYQQATPGQPLYDRATDRDRGQDLRHFFDRLTADVGRMVRCRRSRGSWRPRRTPSTRTGRRTTAPGTSRRCSTH